MNKINWTLFSEKLPDRGQVILAYNKKGHQYLTAFHVIKYFPGDEDDYTYWVELVPPKEETDG